MIKPNSPPLEPVNTSPTIPKLNATNKYAILKLLDFFPTKTKQ